MAQHGPKRHIILIGGGGKGGVGKTTFASLVHETLINRHLPYYTAHDTDGGGSGRRFAATYSEVKAVDPEDTQGLDDVLDGLLTAPDGAACLLDIGGGLDARINRWVTQAGPATAAANNDTGIVHFFLMTDLAQSAQALREVIDQWEGTENYHLIVVRNVFFSTRGRFHCFPDDGDAAARIRNRGWKVIDLLPLDQSVATSVENLGVPFARYISGVPIQTPSGERHMPTVGYRRQVQTWQESTALAIEAALPTLSPPPAASRTGSPPPAPKAALKASAPVPAAPELPPAEHTGGRGQDTPFNSAAVAE
jgi:hypothetical protein